MQGSEEAGVSKLKTCDFFCIKKETKKSVFKESTQPLDI